MHVYAVVNKKERWIRFDWIMQIRCSLEYYYSYCIACAFTFGSKSHLNETFLVVASNAHNQNNTIVVH